MKPQANGVKAIMESPAEPKPAAVSDCDKAIEINPAGAGAYRSAFAGWTGRAIPGLALSGRLRKRALGRTDKPRAETRGRPRKTAARAVAVLALFAAALLIVALATNGDIQPGTGLLPKKAHASPAGTSHAPDDGRIAFSSYTDGNEEIYVMNADGSGLNRLTYNSAWDTVPSWSPDGRRIAFSSSRDGNLEI